MSGSKPCDPSTQTEELVGATTFVSSAEKGSVLLVESAGISATTFGSSSNSAHGTIAGYKFSKDLCLDTTSNVTNNNPDIFMESMPSEKKTEFFSDQTVESNYNESDGTDGGMILQAESTPNEAPSAEVELHSEISIPAVTGDITDHKLCMGIDSPENNAKLVSVDVEGDKSAIVVRRLEDKGCDSIEITGGNPAQDNLAGIPVDISHIKDERASNRVDLVASTDKIFVEDAHTSNLEISNEVRNICVSEMCFSNSANEGNENNFEENKAQDSNAVITVGDVLYKEAERAVCKDDVFAEKISVDGTNTNNSVRTHSDDTSNSPISEIEHSNTANVVNKSPLGNAKSSALAESADTGCITNGIIDGYGSSSFSVDATNVVTEKLGSEVITEAGQKVGVRHSGTDESIFKGNPTDFLSSKNGESSANADHNNTFTEDIHNKIGQSSEDPSPINNIEPSNVNCFTRTHGLVNTVTITNSSSANISEMSDDKLPSIVPGVSTAAMTDGGLESNSEQDVIQNSAEHGVQEEVAKKDPIRTSAEHVVEEVVKQDEVQTDVEDYGGEGVVGQKVRKRFGKKNYSGQVVAFDQETLWYKVTYEDGDEEDLEWEEVEAILLHSKGGKSAVRKRKRSSGLRIREHRKFKRVQRPNEPGDTKAREREPSISVRGKSKESENRKGNEKNGVKNKELLISDAADRSITNARTVERRCSEELNATKRRKLEGESVVELDKATDLRTRNKLIVESVSQSQSNSTENRISTRKNSVSSSSNLEAVSCLNVNILNSTPTYHDVTKSACHESSDKNIPAQGGGIRLIGRKTKKDFGGHLYKGEVIDFDYKANYYKVKYEDGDEEELEWSELEPTLVPSDQKPLSFKNMLRARNMAARPKGKDHPISYKGNADTSYQDLVLPEGGATLSEKQKPASVLEEVKEGLHGKENSSGQVTMPVELIGHTPSPARPHAAARFASAGDADNYEYFGWGEVVGFDRAKCPELRAAKLMPTSLPIVHLAASQHHLAAITAGGQVWLWRNRHGYIHTRCNEWEYIASLEEKGTVLVDVAGPDLDRASSGYEANQEDQVPDPFYLVAVGSDGEDFILQGSQPQETVRTYQLSDEPQYLSLKGSLLQSGQSLLESLGRIVQISVGTVEAPDESPFIGYITDTDHVYIRSATKDYMEEVNLVSGYTGKPIKIQCGRVYHAIIMTDDGRAWTWGRGYYHGPTGFSAATCQPAVGTLVGRKVIDVGCYGEDFIALTNDGDVHQWTHAVPNPADGVYNVPATPLYGRGPCIPHGEKLKQVSIGAGMCAGVTDSGRVHSWRTAMKGGLIGILVPEKEALTPLGHEENQDTAIVSLGNRTATKVICVAGSLIVIVKKKARGRTAGPRKMKQKTNTESGIVGQS
ncbi:uncharacterized protein LOC131034429 isoform X2 [Cryptomeria japonica]|uniref:uncharacterized protein LOC131034429 isoform X2 n=1 Tax=Cryptomeria japonica TaxID=3369 RepID=UPI0025ABEBFE|nr:uncharacterized protein LOC131034429 isoform X2 [Cryptomeria japonica]